MIWLKKNLIFTIVMALLAGALGFELFLVLGQRATARAAEDEFHKKVEEYQRLATQDVLPHEKNVEETKRESARQQEELEVYVASFRNDGKLAEKFAAHPTSSTNALFDIQFFVEEYRQRAAAATGMPDEAFANEYFGFGAYSQAGPNEALLATVYKQRLIVAYILDRLFEARPQSLVSVRRPGEEGAQDAPAAPRGARDSSKQAGGAGFRLSGDLSVAISNVVETSAYEVAFTGRASTLRAFLNELSSFEMPLIVRSVQVAPATAGGTSFESQPSGGRRRSRAPEPAPAAVAPMDGADDAPKVNENIPLVADNLSRFTVAMEFIDVIPPENARK